MLCWVLLWVFSTGEVAALDIQSERSIAQQSDPSLKPNTLSLSPRKAELTRKQHCSSSAWLQYALLFSQSYATYAHTRMYMHTTEAAGGKVAHSLTGRSVVPFSALPVLGKDTHPYTHTFTPTVTHRRKSVGSMWVHSVKHSRSERQNSHTQTATLQH